MKLTPHELVEIRKRAAVSDPTDDISRLLAHIATLEAEGLPKPCNWCQSPRACLVHLCEACMLSFVQRVPTEPG